MNQNKVAVTQIEEMVSYTWERVNDDLFNFKGLSAPKETDIYDFTKTPPVIKRLTDDGLLERNRSEVRSFEQRDLNKRSRLSGSTVWVLVINGALLLFASLWLGLRSRRLR